MVEQARRGEGRETVLGIVHKAFEMHIEDVGLYAFKGGYGKVVGDEVVGYDTRNFDDDVDGELDFPEEYEARVAEEERFARVCEEKYACREGAAGGGAVDFAAVAAGGAAVDFAAVAARAPMAAVKMPAAVGDSISVSL